MIDQTKTYLTRKGLAASLAALDGHTFSISRISVGDGVWPPDTDPTEIEALISPRTDAENLIVSRIDGDTRQLHVEAVVTSAGVQEGFGITEMGIYATLDEAELLYTVVLTPDYPDYVWPEASGVDNKTNIDFYLQVADAGAVMIIEGPSLYVTQARLQETVSELVPKSEASKIAVPNKLIYTGPDARLPVDISGMAGDSAMLGGHPPSHYAQADETLLDIVKGLYFAVAEKVEGTTADYAATPLFPWPLYADGQSIRIIMPEANAANPTLNVSGLGKVPMKDKNATNLAAGKLKAGMPYEFIYYNANFILLGEGGTGGNATSAEVLATKTFTNDQGEQVGTMVNRGAYGITPSAYAQTIPAGYHNGSGIVAAIPTSYYMQASGSVSLSISGNNVTMSATVGFNVNSVYLWFDNGITRLVSDNSGTVLFVVDSGQQIIFRQATITRSSTGFSVTIDVGPNASLLQGKSASYRVFGR